MNTYVHVVKIINGDGWRSVTIICKSGLFADSHSSISQNPILAPTTRLICINNLIEFETKATVQEVVEILRPLVKFELTQSAKSFLS